MPDLKSAIKTKLSDNMEVLYFNPLIGCQISPS
jgi:hypothetical protein